MADLFAFGSGARDLGAENRYGSTGDLKKTQYVMQLLGFPGDADTLKCLLTAAEKGIEVESGVLDVPAGQQDTGDYRTISPFGILPALKEAHYTVAGDIACTVFLEGRGLGNRLAPRNVATLAEQNYWIDIARSDVAGPVETLLRDQILKTTRDASYTADTAAVESARTALAAPLDALNSQLAGKNFIVGDYSFADIHWTAYIHLLMIAGEGELVDWRPNLKQWFDRIRKHKSFSGQNIVAYELLPSLEDIHAKRLQDVVITDF